MKVFHWSLFLPDVTRGIDARDGVYTYELRPDAQIYKGTVYRPWIITGII